MCLYWYFVGTYAPGNAAMALPISTSDTPTKVGIGSKYGAFGWGGGSGPLNEHTAALVRDIIMGSDAHGQYGNAAIDMSLEADAVYIRLFDWTIMRHLSSGTVEAAAAVKPSSSAGSAIKRLAMRTVLRFGRSVPSSPEALTALPEPADTVMRADSFGATVDAKFGAHHLSTVARDLVVLLCSGLVDPHASEVSSFASAPIGIIDSISAAVCICVAKTELICAAVFAKTHSGEIVLSGLRLWHGQPFFARAPDSNARTSYVLCFLYCSDALEHHGVRA